MLARAPDTQRSDNPGSLAYATGLTVCQVDPMLAKLAMLTIPAVAVLAVAGVALLLALGRLVLASG